jgi:hypothetical protein
MAPLVDIAPDFGALAAAHIAFEFMDRGVVFGRRTMSRATV